MWLKYLSGPVIGAVIGYCTNYIAVKMLFYPRKEIRIFGHRLPFTPGAIPKGKPRLAKAIGNIVGKSLVTKEDMKECFQSEETKKYIVDQVMGTLDLDIKHEIQSLTSVSEEVYHETKDKVSAGLSGEIIDSLTNIQIGSIIAEEGGKIIREKTKGTMLEMFLSEEMISSLLETIGNEIQICIQEKGEAYIRPELDRKLNDVEQMSLLEILEKANMNQIQVQNVVENVYEKALNSGIDKVFEKIDISGMVEEKIRVMSVEELEQIVLMVMKKELNTIVNLGAFIGFLLGVLNIFF